MPSPLSEANPQALNEYFSKDALELTDQDIGVVVAELRRQRARWDTAEAGGKKSLPKEKGGEKAQISLKDLGLDI